MTGKVHFDQIRFYSGRVALSRLASLKARGSSSSSLLRFPPGGALEGTSEWFA